jgi:hypothetical protein
MSGWQRSRQRFLQILPITVGARSASYLSRVCVITPDLPEAAMAAGDERESPSAYSGTKSGLRSPNRRRGAKRQPCLEFGGTSHVLLLLVVSS